MSYHFGCCMACRAPFLPDPDLFYQEESQAVFYLQARFKQISTPTTNSQFTGRREKSHLVSKSHFSHAVLFASQMTPAQIHSKIPGWKNDPAAVRLTADNSFALPKSKMDAAVDKRVADQGANVADELAKYTKDVMREFDAENAALMVADPAKFEEEMVTKMISTIASQKTNAFFAAWDTPQAPRLVEHAGLCAWLVANHALLNPEELSLNFTTPCCSLCNDIWDCWARMRQVLAESDIVQLGSIVVMSAASRKVETKVIPVPLNDRYNKSIHQQRLGCLAAYYMHGSLISVSRGGRVGLDMRAPKAAELRPLISVLLWIPLHITCLRMEMMGPISRPAKGRGKGQHNYMGCIDLSISYYLWLLACADGVGVPFECFSTFYVKELVECPAPVWDIAQHGSLLGFIFDEGCPNFARSKATVSYVSDRLIRLYADKIAPLLPLMKGDAAAPVAPAAADFRARATAYFISGLECRSLSPPSAANEDDIRYFMEYAGIAAVLWQVRRYLATEPDAYQGQLDQWIVATMIKEWRNIADHSPEEISLSDAQLIYNMQNALSPESLTGPGYALGSGVEISVLRSMDEDDIKDILAAAGRCSIWKAAVRLKRWQFTRAGRIAQEMGARATLGAKTTAVVLLDTGGCAEEHLGSHASASRFVGRFYASLMQARAWPAPVGGGDPKARASLSARLISARLASTPAMSTDSPQSHCAGPGRASRRRGCRGRG